MKNRYGAVADRWFIKHNREDADKYISALGQLNPRERRLIRRAYIRGKTSAAAWAAVFVNPAQKQSMSKTDMEELAQLFRRWGGWI